jgi:hypothetical protein
VNRGLVAHGCDDRSAVVTHAAHGLGRDTDTVPVGGCGRGDVLQHAARAAHRSGPMESDFRTVIVRAWFVRALLPSLVALLGASGERGTDVRAPSTPLPRPLVRVSATSSAARAIARGMVSSRLRRVGRVTGWIVGRRLLAA